MILSEFALGRWLCKTNTNILQMQSWSNMCFVRWYLINYNQHCDLFRNKILIQSLFHWSKNFLLYSVHQTNKIILWLSQQNCCFPHQIWTHGGERLMMTKLSVGCLLACSSLSGSLCCISLGIWVTLPSYIRSVAHVTVSVIFSQLSSALGAGLQSGRGSPKHTW